MGLRPTHSVHGSARSSFAGVTRCLRALNLSSSPCQTRQPLTVEGATTAFKLQFCEAWRVGGGRATGVQRPNRTRRVAGALHDQARRRPLTPCAAAAARRQCALTGKVANNGYNVTFSHKRNKKLQGVNLQEKKVYWPEKQRWVTLKISTKVSSCASACLLSC